MKWHALAKGQAESERMEFPSELQKEIPAVQESASPAKLIAQVHASSSLHGVKANG